MNITFYLSKIKCLLIINYIRCQSPPISSFPSSSVIPITSNSPSLPNPSVSLHLLNSPNLLLSSPGKRNKALSKNSETGTLKNKNQCPSHKVKERTEVKKDLKCSFVWLGSQAPFNRWASIESLRDASKSLLAIMTRTWLLYTEKASVKEYQTS